MGQKNEPRAWDNTYSDAAMRAVRALCDAKLMPRAILTNEGEWPMSDFWANAAKIIDREMAHNDMVRILAAINDFWSDVAITQKSGACLSPSALLLDDDTPIAAAISAALAKARG